MTALFQYRSTLFVMAGIFIALTLWLMFAQGSPNITQTQEEHDDSNVHIVNGNARQVIYVGGDVKRINFKSGAVRYFGTIHKMINGVNYYKRVVKQWDKFGRLSLI